MAQFILASASPRRKELLEKAGYTFAVLVSDADETLPDGISPEEAVRLNAARKAQAVSALHPGDVVLGCDTVVAIGGKILGKPRSAAEAKEMLRQLSGRTHTVYSGVCITDGTTRQPGSRWTRPAPTAFRDSAACWSGKSPATTATWSACR